jgi:hypothetical protein
MTYYQRKSQDQAEVIDDLRKREKYVWLYLQLYSYTTLKYGMLINQNHEMSIKLKKKDEIIAHLRSTISAGGDSKKESQGPSSQLNNEDNSSDFQF